MLVELLSGDSSRFRKNGSGRITSVIQGIDMDVSDRGEVLQAVKPVANHQNFVSRQREGPIR